MPADAQDASARACLRTDTACVAYRARSGNRSCRSGIARRPAWRPCVRHRRRPDPRFRPVAAARQPTANPRRPATRSPPSVDSRPRSSPRPPDWHATVRATRRHRRSARPAMRPRSRTDSRGSATANCCSGRRRRSAQCWGKTPRALRRRCSSPTATALPSHGCRAAYRAGSMAGSDAVAEPECRRAAHRPRRTVPAPCRPAWRADARSGRVAAATPVSRPETWPARCAAAGPAIPSRRPLPAGRAAAPGFLRHRPRWSSRARRAAAGSESGTRCRRPRRSASAPPYRGRNPSRARASAPSWHWRR